MGKSKKRLAVEVLEDRTMPALFGVPWPDPEHLTLSFVPDGTSVLNGNQSQLFQILNQQAPTAVWETAILRAYQTWAVNANINIGLVADSGAPLGASGLPQGDSRFGDIRIATYPLAPDVVAIGTPFDWAAGTWSGDVKLNTSYTFGINPTAPGAYDLFSVMLHEAGHSLGLAEGMDPASPMFKDYLGVRSGLTPQDIANLQALYGARQPDAFDAKASNDTLATATKLTSPQNSALLSVDGDLTTLQDVDWYAYRPQAKATGLTIDLKTAGISLFVGQVSVYDAHGSLVSAAASTGPLDGDQIIHLDITQPGFDFSTVYFKVQKASNDVFGIGSYQLQIVSEAPGHAGGTGGGSPSVNPQLPTNNNPNHVVNLQPKIFRSDARFAYAVQGSISLGAVDFYRFKTPNLPDGQTNAMTVSVWGTDPGGLDPIVGLYDSLGNPVAAQLLVNQDGTYSIQLPHVPPNTKFLVAVAAAPGNAAHALGNYFLGINFNDEPITLDTFVNGQVLDAAHANGAGTLQVFQTQLMHFVIIVGGNSGALNVTITDPSGGTVYQADIAAGSSLTTSLVLKPQTYKFHFSAQGLGPGGSLFYSLQALAISDPVGPDPVDTTMIPGLSSGTPTYLWDGGFGLILNNPGPLVAPRLALSAPPSSLTTLASGSSPAGGANTVAIDAFFSGRGTGNGQPGIGALPQGFDSDPRFDGSFFGATATAGPGALATLSPERISHILAESGPSGSGSLDRVPVFPDSASAGLGRPDNDLAPWFGGWNSLPQSAIGVTITGRPVTVPVGDAPTVPSRISQLPPSADGWSLASWIAGIGLGLGLALYCLPRWLFAPALGRWAGQVVGKGWSHWFAGAN